MADLRSQMRYMNPYDIHKTLINHYILKKPGDVRLLKSKVHTGKTDNDILKENHKFLWEEDPVDTWESQFAKKYYDKLFKEYCIGDLSHYKENKIALRWRIEKEVVTGKGQFICGNKHCSERDGLKTWEVNFGYVESGKKKNALVKIRLCKECSTKLNYHTKKREVKRLKKTSKRRSKHSENDTVEQKNNTSTEIDKPTTSQSTCEISSSNVQQDDSSHWDSVKPAETKSREDEMEEYLQDLLL